jgi:hypothetical protein
LFFLYERWTLGKAHAASISEWIWVVQCFDEFGYSCRFVSRVSSNGSQDTWSHRDGAHVPHFRNMPLATIKTLLLFYLKFMVILTLCVIIIVVPECEIQTKIKVHAGNTPSRASRLSHTFLHLLHKKKTVFAFIKCKFIFMI